MRSDKYSKQDPKRNTRSYDGWEDVQQLFQNRDKEKQDEQRQSRRDEQYQKYLAMRNREEKEPEEVKIHVKKKKSQPDNYSQKRPKKKKKKRVLRVFSALLLILIAVGATGALFVWGMLEKVGTEEVDKSNLGINSQVAQELKDYQNIALLGVDARDMNDYKTSRTDAIIILSIDKTHKTIRQISVFRDTYLHVNDKFGYDKITNVHAHSGTSGTLQTLNENMDLNIEDVVLVNWKAVADAVDGLGGIDIEVRNSEIQEMNKYIIDTQKNIGGSKELIQKPGMQTLNGNQAVTYARIRKDSSEGDYRRNERMKIVVSAAVEKAKSTSPVKLNQIASTVLPQIKTNMDSLGLMKVMYGFIRYDMKGSAGWPFNTQGWTDYNGAWCGPPVTLKRNVEALHSKFFKQPDYTTTQTVQNISDEISRRTGYY